MDIFANWDLQLRIIGAVALAMLLGGTIGYERELANKPAGFRTHMLLAGAAALLVGLGDILVEGFSETPFGEYLRVDPLRIVEAVVTGVAFLGAGTIFRGGANGSGIAGLTTAASLLLVSGVGMTVAMEQYLLAVGVTLLTLVVLRVLHILEPRGQAARRRKSGAEPRE